MIELLESRVAPAIVFTYRDVDGDRVTVAISKGSPGDATFTHPAVPGSFGDQLQVIDLNGNQVFKGASITVTAKPQDVFGNGQIRGDGLANVGFLNATGIDLGTVSIRGDLAKITAGDTTTATPGLASLRLGSLGRWGTSTGAPDFSSVITGKLGALTVNTDMPGALTAGAIGSAAIGGTMSEFLFSSGAMGPVKIGGNVTGIISVGGKLAKLSVGGSLMTNFGRINVHGDSGLITIGGNVDTANILIDGNLAGVKIGGSVFGIGGSNSALISVNGATGVVDIRGDLGNAAEVFSIGPLKEVRIGGSVFGSATELDPTAIISLGDIGTVKIAGDLRAGIGGHSAEINAGGNLGKVTIGGSVIGGPRDFSGYIFSRGDIGSVFIGENLRGGSPLNGSDPSVNSSGYIEGGRIGSVAIGGSIIAGLDFNNADAPTKSASIRARDNIGSLTVRGGLIGNTNGDDVEVIISARGQRGLGATAKNDVAIGKISIGGGTTFARILAGYDVELTGKNADAQIGTVTIGGDALMTNIIAGVQTGGDGFGDGNDAKISGAGVKDNADSLGAVSRIASIVIKGAALGTLAANDFALFGIEAQHLASVRVGGAAIPLRPGAGNDFLAFAAPLGPTMTPFGDGFDFHAYEVLTT